MQRCVFRFFMCSFLLYIEAHRSKSPIIFLILSEMAPVVLILAAKRELRCPIEDCVDFGCGNHTFVENNHCLVHNIEMKHTWGLKFHTGNPKNTNFLLIPKSPFSWLKWGIN